MEDRDEWQEYGTVKDMPSTEREETMGDELISKLTEIVREADDRFAQVGGSTRHWVRDCFLPLVEQGGLEIIDAKQRGESIRMAVQAGRGIGKYRAQKEIERLTRERDEGRRWARHYRAIGDFWFNRVMEDVDICPELAEIILADARKQGII